MSDENTTDSPPSNVPDIPPKPVEATQTVTTDVVEISATNLPPESTEATPPTTTDAEGNSTSIAKETSSAPIGAPRIEESRSESRTHVRWHVDAFVDGQNVHHGFIKDISLKGADIFLEHNLQNENLIKLHIHVPPIHVPSDHHVVELSAKIIYVTHDAHELLFRTGIKFLKFNIESEQAYLQSRIEKQVDAEQAMLSASSFT